MTTMGKINRNNLFEWRQSTDDAKSFLRIVNSGQIMSNRHHRLGLLILDLGLAAFALLSVAVTLKLLVWR
jgi:hypothetical protein